MIYNNGNASNFSVINKFVSMIYIIYMEWVISVSWFISAN